MRETSGYSADGVGGGGACICADERGGSRCHFEGARGGVARVVCGRYRDAQRLVPAETIVISGGEEAWKHQEEVLQTSETFHAGGGKLLKLEFRTPRCSASAMSRWRGVRTDWRWT